MQECGTTSSNNVNVVVENILCILTYGGSTVHIAINYTLLCLDVGAMGTWWFLTKNSQRHRSDEGQVQPSTTSVAAAAPLASFVFVIAFQIGLCLVVGCSGISIVWCACLGWYWHKRRIFAVARLQEGREDETTTTTTATHLLSQKPQHPSSNQHEDERNTKSNHNDTEPLQQQSGDSLQSVDAPTPSDAVPEQGVVITVEILLGSLNALVLLYYAWSAEPITTVAHACAIVLGIVLSKMEQSCLLSHAF
ncbi:hypothetical protein ACA910_017694 [Epithemia clementina (nom. ined.)]